LNPGEASAGRRKNAVTLSQRMIPCIESGPAAGPVLRLAQPDAHDPRPVRIRGRGWRAVFRTTEAIAGTSQPLFSVTYICSICTHCRRVGQALRSPADSRALFQRGNNSAVRDRDDADDHEQFDQRKPG